MPLIEVGTHFAGAVATAKFTPAFWADGGELIVFSNTTATIAQLNNTPPAPPESRKTKRLSGH